jgi:putative nucleotidyltransferase with HDIG domain
MADREVSGQIEFAIQKIKSLSVLPAVINRFLSQLNSYQLSPSSLTDFFETEPALAVQIIRLMRQQLNEDACCSVRSAVESLSLRQIRNMVLSLSIYSAKPEEQTRFEFRKGLIRHSIAVGCCARQIAETAVSDISPDLAYLAGLLHDIGKLALDEALPKSFARIVELAEKQSACICDVEQQNLGIDHTVVGKRIALRWQIPQQIVLPIWLHHSDLISFRRTVEELPQIRIAQVVQLADIIARQEGLGLSGSFDQPQIPQSLLESLQITNPLIEQIRRQLDSDFERKAFFSDIDVGQISGDFSRPQAGLQETAAQLAEENLHLSKENQKLQVEAGCLKFIAEFLSSINPQMEAVEIAQKFAAEWQKFYQLGPVCLYLLPTSGRKTMPAVIVESQTNSRLLLLQLPAGQQPIPKSIAENFAVEMAADLDWLFDQLGVNFEQTRTRIAPIVCNGVTLAVLVFELRQPVSNQQLQNILQTIIPPMAAVLSAALAGRQHLLFAELFAWHKSPPPVQPKPERQTEDKQAKAEPQTSQPVASPPRRVLSPDTVGERVEPPVVSVIEPVEPVFDALTEMAAGAAHELNNPLVVITGRAQLFAESEQDEQKKKILGQISDSAKKISRIIDELMTFANPKQPEKKQIKIQPVLDSAVRLAEQKAKKQGMNVEISVAQDAEEILADSDQITEALAKIICNAVESYLTKSGPVKIAAQSTDEHKSVKLTISDLGCGMDSQTLQKATLPFFSAKPAGRKRGMGLAIAKRLIELNDGSLQITSKPAEGTTATVLLPVR